MCGEMLDRPTRTNIYIHQLCLPLFLSKIDCTFIALQKLTGMKSYIYLPICKKSSASYEKLRTARLNHADVLTQNLMGDDFGCFV